MLLWLTTIARADTIVTITTPLGSFDILMLEDDAPIAVANFLGYVNRGDYTGTFLHPSIPEFVLQGGGYRYDPDDNAAPHITTRAPIVNESKISNTRGTVAMASLMTLTAMMTMMVNQIPSMLFRLMTPKRRILMVAALATMPMPTMIHRKSLQARKRCQIQSYSTTTEIVKYRC